MKFSNFLSPKLRFSLLKNSLRVNEHETGILASYGMGDVYSLCTLIPAFKRFHQTSVVLFLRREHLGIAKMFLNGIDRVIVVEHPLLPITMPKELGEEFFFFCEDSKNRCRIGHVLTLRYRDQICLRPKERFVDALRRVLDLPANAERTMPVVMHNYSEQARMRFEKYRLPQGKTAVLFPGAITMRNLPIAFWQFLSERVRTAGWEVRVNARDASILPNIRRVDFPLEEALPFMELCGWCIAERSGICDVLESARCRKTVLYSQKGDTIEWNVKVRGKSEIVRYSVWENFSFRVKNIEEILIPETDWELVAPSIL